MHSLDGYKAKKEGQASQAPAARYRERAALLHKPVACVIGQSGEGGDSSGGGHFTEEKTAAEVMAWWHKVVAFPVKRAWVTVVARVKPPADEDGIVKLHEDVRMCGYQDVQIMWEMVRRSEMESSSNKTKRRKKRSLWRLSAWSSSCRRTSNR